MLKYRIISGSLFLMLVAALTIWAPTWLALAFVMVLCALGTLEVVHMLTHAGYPALRWTTLVLGQVMLLGAALHASGQGGWWADHLNAIMPGLIAAAIFLGCLFRSNQERSLGKIAGSFLTVGYVPALMQFFVLLLFTTTPEYSGDGRMLLVFGVLVIKSSDIGAYFTGRAIGKNKLIPVISPAKTWEGVVGGVILSSLVSLLFLFSNSFRLCGIPFEWWDAVILGVLLGATGVVGDLIESMLKRATGIKDSGSWIRGMGGIMDVLDSPIFALPALYLYVQLVLVREGLI